MRHDLLAPSHPREAASHLDTNRGAHSRAGFSFHSFLGSSLLWIAACFGALILICSILTMTGHFGLILFKTGSMSPTIPAGSVAFAQRITAPEIRVGDILTVDREGQLPVTHRVTGVKPGESTTTAVITMRGDANPNDDATPYTVSEVRKTLISVPGAAYAIASMNFPVALGATTILATFLVGWAFWPRQHHKHQ